MVGDEDVILAYAVGKYSPRGGIWVEEEEALTHDSAGTFSPFDDGTEPEDANSEGVEDEYDTKGRLAKRVTAAEGCSVATTPRWASENGGPRLWRCTKTQGRHDVEWVKETIESVSK